MPEPPGGVSAPVRLGNIVSLVVDKRHLECPDEFCTWSSDSFNEPSDWTDGRRNEAYAAWRHHRKTVHYMAPLAVSEE
jgi:hypothetical protein